MVYKITMFRCCQQGECLRYCDKCSSYKPPRAHHCRVCRRCVLKMVGIILLILTVRLFSINYIVRIYVLCRIITVCG